MILSIFNRTQIISLCSEDGMLGLSPVELRARAQFISGWYDAKSLPSQPQMCANMRYLLQVLLRLYHVSFVRWS